MDSKRWQLIALLALVVLASGSSTGCKLRQKKSTRTTAPAPDESDLDATNRDDIQRFPDELRLGGDMDIVRQLGSIKTAPKENAPFVAIVTRDTVVRKFATRDDYTLVTFDDHGQRKGGWLRQTAFVQSLNTGPTGTTTTATPAPISASSRQAAWLGSITGRDNDAANYRRAKISGAGTYTVTIDNQFGFTCGLTFDQNGRPSRLTSCQGSKGWTASPSSIGLACSEGGGQEICTSSSYMLGSGSYSNGAKFQLIRRL